MADDPRFQAARLVLALRQAGVMQHLLTEAMEKTPREMFVPRPFADDAWENVELPIDCGQTMTRPVTVGQMLEALDLNREHTVLEVGTGSGYVAAVMSRLARRVYSIDRYRTLTERARQTLETLGVASRVEVRLSDGLMGWPEAAPFDRIVLMGSAPGLPEDLARQLAPGGVAVLPVEREGQAMVVRLEKLAAGGFRETSVIKARFAPLQPGVAREL
ncbi:MAG TPA: protein-L-isoaspartate(D-aspartate) O-methyltransferase [Gemmatimonadales bacterium]|nr:protein-L-isoaspartate(D-aspartate) O-methyltransferase [Gemmatimonadales bacterium]